MGSVPASAISLGASPLSASALAPVVAAKQQLARRLMQQNPAFFAIGIGQSLDDPRQAALVIYVDRARIPAQLPATMNGIRTRYIFMDRLHVTRSYAASFPAAHRCAPPAASETGTEDLFKPRSLDLP
jgi:hypothetical protein